MTTQPQPPADEKLMPCRWCNSNRVHVEREETSWTGEKVVGVDDDNGPIYYVECDECMSRGPLASWAIDAREKWNATPPAAPAEAKRYDIHGKLHRVTGNPVALTEESPSGKWVLASDFDALQAKHDAAVGLLRAFTDAGKEAHDYAMKTGQDRVPAKCWLLLMKFGVLLEENAARIEALATTPKE